MTDSTSARSSGRLGRGLVTGSLLAAAVLISAVGCSSASLVRSSSPERDVAAPRGGHRGAVAAPLPSQVWPAHGQAAYLVSGQSRIHSSPNQHPAPIASIAKVMTAYVVLRDHPLQIGQDGPTITLTDADVDDTERRRARHESLVAVATGEHLSELQALQALLLPSANNISVVLARWDAGSVENFVDRMNTIARTLGMTNTRYTDPSGYDGATVSTAADQVRIADQAMRVPVFASIVATPTTTLPVAGTVHNTDTLLGRDGFIGVKTGSDSAAGGCFAFQAIRLINGTQTTITGVVLGQPGANQIAAGLAAADDLVTQLSGDRSSPEPPQQRMPPPDAPGNQA